MQKLPFNEWSKERIRQGRKFATSRTSGYRFDPRVKHIQYFPLWVVKNYLFSLEGADSPEEFEKVWNDIHPYRKFDPNQSVFVHFGDFRDEK